MTHTLLVGLQIAAAVTLILFVVMQAKGTGLSAAFGGEGMFYRSKRGVEKLLFRGTVAVALILGISSLLLTVLEA
jgi:preprotein translocase subunit SecG